MNIPRTAAVLISLAFCKFALGQHTKLDKDLLRTDPDKAENVIVRYKSAAQDVVAARELPPGATLRHKLPLLHASALSISRRDLELLAADSEVEYIAPDRQVQATAFSGTEDYGWMAVTGIYSPTGSLPYDGTGIAVAVIDSGIHDREDLKSRIVYKESFVSGDNHPDDFNGHAVHVIGIIAGNGKKSTGSQYDYRIRGIAPNTSIVSLRVLDKYGVGTDSAVIAAIQRAIQLKDKYNIRVINLSLGRPVYSSYKNDPLCQAVEQAWKAGIVVVVSAGNDGRKSSGQVER